MKSIQMPFEQWKREFFASGIKSSNEYAKEYKKHPGWPACPYDAYPDHFTSWLVFLGKGKGKGRQGKRYHLSYENWKDKVKELGIKSSTMYRDIAEVNQEIPTNPNIAFKDYWRGWKDVFGGRGTIRKYLSFQELQNLVKERDIRTAKEYHNFYLSNKKSNIPSNPPSAYKEEWESWPSFLRDGVGKNKKLFYEELKIEVRSKEIRSWLDYRRHSLDNPRWPCYPPKFFKNEWVSWPEFLGVSFKGRGRRPKQFLSLEDLQAELRLLNIVSFVEYKHVRLLQDKFLWPSLPLDYYKIEGTHNLFGFNSKKDMLSARKKKYPNRKTARHYEYGYPNSLLVVVKTLVAF